MSLLIPASRCSDLRDTMTFAVALDFSTKQERPVALDEVNDARAQGSYCWIDLHAPSDDELRKFLETLKIQSRANRRDFRVRSSAGV